MVTFVWQWVVICVGLQMKLPKFEAQTEWVKPTEFPDLRKVEQIEID